MLGKLLKQDFRATARIMLPLYAAVPVLGLFTNLITHLCENQTGFLINAISTLVSFIFALALIAAVVTTVVLMVLRFYRNLMTDEGYLMFTLPVSTTELIFSKLIVSVVWFLGTFAVDALGLLLSGMLGGYEDVARFRFVFSFGMPYSMPVTQAQAGWLSTGLVVLVILCGLALCLMTYAAMAIGQSFKKNKGLMSVVFFFVRFDAAQPQQLPMDEASTQRAVCMLCCLPNGIQAMSRDIPGLVQTSLNLGILTTDADTVQASFCVRSSVCTQKEMLVARLRCLMVQLGGTVDVTGDYPAWEYRKDSPLRECMVAVFREQYGRDPKVEAIHAGVECGLFAGKLPELDCVSFGPDLTEIHTCRERMHIASVQRVWRYTLEVLRRCK